MLVVEAFSRGFAAHLVNWLGLTSRSDCALWPQITAGSDVTGELVVVDQDGTVRFRRYPVPFGND